MAFSSGGSDSDEVFGEINVTPLVDVMLVLLVTFIITAPMLTNTINVNLPDTQPTFQQKEPEKPTVISVDETGKVYIDKEGYPLVEIEAELIKRKTENPEIRLNLNADEKVNYGVIAKVMAAIERAGIDRLSFISEHEGN
ncbi:biopolymer transporter ExbD [Cellvibrio zantedeschiae]|uniref:Biopolymer transporter ExbD n=1 Tax=Cellvibrio zantedeschiae TaxID=1237077 RepID=A0ABQ3AYX0_9GAMM|nr:biopolymer transporter ExbD [Cellvibrio zantedeschiae]GGY68498.1 biopolymer transporter ExbD [Cellvibrio zantedeschiae]